jgi:hypothetical protein
METAQRRMRGWPVILIVGVLSAGLILWALSERYRFVQQVRAVRDFEQVLQENRNASFTKAGIVRSFGKPEVIEAAGSDEILIYPANDGPVTFFSYTTRVKIVCRKSDGTLRTFQLRSD